MRKKILQVKICVFTSGKYVSITENNNFLQAKLGIIYFTEKKYVSNGENYVSTSEKYNFTGKITRYHWCDICFHYQEK